MKTIMRILFIYLLFYSNIYAKESNKLHVTFELVNSNSKYKEVLNDKIKDYTRDGLHCYTVKISKSLRLRCNDTNTTQDYKRTTRILTNLEIDYKVVSLEKEFEIEDAKDSTVVGSLAHGYKELENKNYTKAREIFSKLYSDSNNVDTAYAMALLSYKEKKYSDVRKFLEEYNHVGKKSTQLYYDSIVTQYYNLKKHKRHTNANKLLNKYKKDNPKLYSLYEDEIISRANLYTKKGAYNKAKRVLKSYKTRKTRSKIFDVEYAQALKLQKLNREAEAIKLMMPYLPTHSKAAIFYENLTLARAGEFIKNREYNKAREVLNPIFSSSKKAQDLYSDINYQENLNRGWGLFQDDEPKKALKFFEIACDIKKDKGCLEGVMYSAYKSNNYCKASFSSQEVYHNSLDQEAVFIAYDSAVKMNDQERATYWYSLLNNKSRASSAISLEPCKTKEERLEAAKNLKKNPYSFKLTTQYLQCLKETNADEQFNALMKKSKSTFKSAYQITALNGMDSRYKHAKITDLYVNGRYSECYNYANTVLTQSDKLNIKRTHAWCAFKAGKYSQAQKLFQNLNYSYKTTTDDLYAQALSEYKNNNYPAAKATLKRLKQKNVDDRQKKSIANLYLSMGKEANANIIISSLETQETQDELQVIINQSNRYNTNKVNAVAGGLHYKKRSIASNLHSFTQYYLPIDIDIYDKSSRHWYVDADAIHLYDKFRGSYDERTLEHDLGETTISGDSSSNTVFMPKFGLELENVTMEIGSTPIGAKIDPEITGLLSVYTTNETWNTHVNLLKTSLDDSMVSLVGQSIQNPTAQWGRVTKTGVEAGINYKSNLSASLDFGYYPSIGGENIIDNSQMKLVATLIHHTAVTDYSYLDYGFIGILDAYERNSDLYTYGHGAYFSPQDFILGNLMVDIGNISSPDYYWKAKVSLGYETFKVEDTQKYPIRDAVVTDANLSGIVDGYTESGLTYKFALGLGFNINDNLDLLAATSFEKMYDYNLIQIGFSFVYFFENKNRSSLYNFHNPHRIESTLE